MIPLVRPTIAGELWWSSQARHLDLLGLTAPFTSHMLLVGNKRSLGSPLFPRQIERALVSLRVDSDATTIIDRHTLLSFYAPFLSEEKIGHARDCMTENGNAEFALGLAPMGDYPTHLKCCPECIEDDHRTHGAAIWRTAQQAPGCIVCLRHKRALSTTNVSARVQSQIAHFVTADRAEYKLAPPIPKAHFEDALWFANAGQALLAQPLPIPGPARLAALYRFHLERRGFIDNFGRLLLADMMPAFLQRLERFITLIYADLPIENARDNWLARLARYPRSEQSPLQHLLMLRFLKLEVVSALKHAVVLPPYTAPCSFCPPAPRRSTRITEEKVNRHRKQWIKLRIRLSKGSLRTKADRLYSWLWRNDRAWLRYYARSAAKMDIHK